MIAKVIGLKKSGAPRRGFSAVIEYIERDAGDVRERGLAPLDETACGVLNLEADSGTSVDRREISAAMNATAMLSRRMRNSPAYHFSVSWVEGEHLTRVQCESTVAHFVQGLGMAECETFWAVHRDTDNDHVHGVVNTVHPEEGGRGRPATVRLPGAGEAGARAGAGLATRHGVLRDGGTAARYSANHEKNAGRGAQTVG